ncbi:hypothetical protein ACFFLM_06465 [Deinococcus oregonensis]|uniref:Uncharacterized protein n=1 Tax=Deinococcus oregonensis TaxID=1805970 RepID=A0ABV6AVS9_9DEIO
MKFLRLTVAPGLTFHGIDDTGKERLEEDEGGEFAVKLIALARIQSVSEQYVLVNGPAGRLYYWRYREPFEAVQQALQDEGALVMVVQD